MSTYNTAMTTGTPYSVFSEVARAAGYPKRSGVEIPQIWSPDIIEILSEESVIPAITTSEFERQISGYGDNLVIREEGDVTWTTYTRGGQINYPHVVESKCVLSIDQAHVWATMVDPVDLQQSDHDLVPRWVKRAGISGAELINADILTWMPAQASTYTSGATAGRNGDVNLGASGAALDFSSTTAIHLINLCGQVLDEMNVPQKDRWMVLPPAAFTRLKESDIRNASITGDPNSPIRHGRVGEVDRFTLYSSNQLLNAVDTGHTCYSIPFGWKRATAFAKTIDSSNGPEILQDKDIMGKFIRGMLVYGRKVVRSNCLGCLYCYFS